MRYDNADCQPLFITTCIVRRVGRSSGQQFVLRNDASIAARRFRSGDLLDGRRVRFRLVVDCSDDRTSSTSRGKPYGTKNLFFDKNKVR